MSQPNPPDPVPALKPVDPRAGKLCSNCNAPRPAEYAVRYHCGYCKWWECPRCHALNDPQGRNDKTSLAGQSKGWEP